MRLPSSQPSGSPKCGRHQQSRGDTLCRDQTREAVGWQSHQRDPSVGLGIFLSATWVLGLHHGLDTALAPERDQVGLREELRRMPRRVGGTRRDDDFDPDKL